MVTQQQQFFDDQAANKADLNKRLEDLGWGLFLLMLGVIWLMPAGIIPPGVWLLGTGLIMLGLNWVRYLKGIQVSAFTLILGGFALIAGLGSLLGVKLSLFAILLVLIGASTVLKSLFATKS